MARSFINDNVVLEVQISLTGGDGCQTAPGKLFFLRSGISWLWSACQLCFLIHRVKIEVIQYTLLWCSQMLRKYFI